MNTIYFISDIEEVAAGDMVVCEAVEMIQEGLEEVAVVASGVMGDQEVYPRVPQDIVCTCVVYLSPRQKQM
jgi:hypothetical protein